MDVHLGVINAREKKSHVSGRPNRKGRNGRPSSVIKTYEKIRHFSFLKSHYMQARIFIFSPPSLSL